MPVSAKVELFCQRQPIVCATTVSYPEWHKSGHSVTVCLGPNLRVVMRRQNCLDILGIARNVRCPRAEAGMPVHCPDPFREEFALGLLLLVILAFHFQNQGLTIRQSDQEIGSEFMDHSFKC